MNKEVNKMNDYITQLYNKVPLKILSCVSTYSHDHFLAKELEDEIKLSKGAVNQSLRLLLKLDIIKRIKKGNLFLYSINPDNILLKQFKIFETILTIQELLKEISPYSYQIILFGSCATGTNSIDSDIDLFIHSESVEKTRKICNKYNPKIISLRPIIQDTLELTATEKHDKAFYAQIKKGIILWEGETSSE